MHMGNNDDGISHLLNEHVLSTLLGFFFHSVFTILCNRRYHYPFVEMRKYRRDGSTEPSFDLVPVAGCVGIKTHIGLTRKSPTLHSLARKSQMLFL